jgi:hypothetical protein
MTGAITDLTIIFGESTETPPVYSSSCTEWQRLEKDLYLHFGPESAYLNITQKQETELT